MKLYSIMPLFVDHADEIVEDIIRQYNDGIATEALFKMTLTPEGDPVINKAAILSDQYKIFNSKLRARGHRSGILVQASIGHGYKLTTPIPFTALVGLTDGETKYTACPYDEDFRAYIRDAMATLAATEPSSIMVDDDFRLFARSCKGCACPLHMREISRRAGYELTRESLLEMLNTDTAESRRVMQIFYDTQIDSLIGAARAMREGIDSVDPTIQGSFCLCGDNCEGVGEIAKILAGKGNPVIVRVNNGKYCSPGARGIANSISRCATQMSSVGDGVDYFLAETDTCPQNRYSTSASSLHTHFTLSILEGVKGCKHWITRLTTYEPKSGEAYRKKLAKHAGFYRALSEIVPRVEWFGARIPLPKSPTVPMPPLNEFVQPSDEIPWAMCVLERLGIPFYFSNKSGGSVFLDCKRDRFLTDAELEEILSGDVFIDAICAQRLKGRGFGDKLGVEITDRTPEDKKPTKERILVNGASCSLQMELKKLTPTSGETMAHSILCSSPDSEHVEDLYPAVTSYKNSLGGRAVVFAGTPRAKFVYGEAFSFLNESRKLQLITLMKDGAGLPIYYPGDAEVYIKAGYLDGGIFCAFTNIGLDNLDEVTLTTDRPVTSISRLTPSGALEECEYTCGEDNTVTVNVPANILDPVILLIK